MSLYTLDANAVSAVLGGSRVVSERIRTALLEGHTVTLNAVTYFEVKRGLYLPRFERKLRTFMRFVDSYGMLPLDIRSLDNAAEIYQTLRQAGTPLEDADILIVGTALAHDAILVTRNTKHFDRIEVLTLENWEDA